MTVASSLRENLVAPRPRIQCYIACDHRLASPSCWAEPGAVGLWGEFTVQALDESLGAVLDMPAVFSAPSSPSPTEGAEAVLRTRADFKGLMERDGLVLTPLLRRGAQLLGFDPGLEFEHEVEVDDEESPNPICPRSVLHLRVEDTKRTAKNSSRSMSSTATLVVGVYGASSTWSFDSVEPLLQADHEEQQGLFGDAQTRPLIRPLAQLATECAAAHARYGYVETDAELVACYFKPETGASEAATGREKAGLANQKRMAEKAQEHGRRRRPVMDSLWPFNKWLKVVPMRLHQQQEGREQEKRQSRFHVLCMRVSQDPNRRRAASGEARLTPHLAVWWLAMLALQDIHRLVMRVCRAVSGSDEAGPEDEEDEGEGSRGGWLFRRCFARRDRRVSQAFRQFGRAEWPGRLGDTPTMWALEEEDGYLIRRGLDER